MTGAQIRKMFLEYFAENGHTVVGSSSLVPANDPTLMFTNAGMNQFKDVFTGKESRGFTRAATSQKCLRVSGKHNDLENVGRTARHHTFFEMLGNFSFGDYFKRDAIKFGWEFLTEKVGLDPDRLWITIFRDDDEAFALWQELTPVPASRIIRCGEKDNFWSMGDTGPCGPCSEIHYDQGPNIYPCPEPETCSPACDCDRYLELWNLVFMQFDRSADGKMTPLPKPSIDTGMGLERVTAVSQKVCTNYDTDLFLPLIKKTSEIAGVAYGAGPESDVSLRVVADHIRSAVFLIADGVMPGNEGRGYVLRRIMRRALRHGKLLGISEPFFHKVAGTVIDIMESNYPELADKRDYVAKVILHEEERFIRTLDRGLQLLSAEVDKVASTTKTIPGDVIFKLYDTYGFPLDLIEDIVRDRGIKLDEEGFTSEMEAQKEKARSAWKGSGEEAVSDLYRKLRDKSGPTEFVGYNVLETRAIVTALAVKGELAESAKAGDEVELALNITPFYGESGGQMGDGGVLSSDDATVEITKASKPLPHYVVLSGKVTRGELKTGAQVDARVESGARFYTMQNHSAIHLLQAALQKVLGDHVKQAGSLVGPERMRFDFTHFAPLTKEELRKVEEQVNVWIAQNHKVCVSEENYEDAVKTGVMALFGEKYEDTVRVVRMGEVSAELCGGTHARSTGDIGFFKILSESGVAAGVRRIEGLTSARALNRVWELEDRLGEIGVMTKSTGEDAVDRVKRLLASLKDAEREISSLRSKLAGGASKDILADVKVIAGVNVLAGEAPVSDVKGLREFADTVRERLKSGVFALGIVDADGKAALLVGVTADLTGKIRAGDIIKPLAEAVGGKGGGKPELAQAGGPEGGNLAKALELFYAEAEKALTK